jgi:PAS domain S-box-containing protein
VSRRRTGRGALGRVLRRLDVDVADALADINLPTVVVNKDGIIKWLNDAAIEIVGDRVGTHYGRLVTSESRRRVDERFVRKLLGSAVATSYDAKLIARDGRIINVEIDSVRLESNGRVVGVFGIVDVAPVDPLAPTTRPGSAPLTPRQHEVLALLAEGASTNQIAEMLHLSRETVRNHIRGALKSLGAHSRLEAVARGRKLGLV